MSDEDNFYRALVGAGIYRYASIEFKIKHPSEPGDYLFIDNVGQKGDTLFVFEGKTGKPEKAFGQLRIAYLSLSDPLYKRTFTYKEVLNSYSKVRLFYYSFKRGLLIEYDPRMTELQQCRFRDLNELSEILRKI